MRFALVCPDNAGNHRIEVQATGADVRELVIDWVDALEPPPPGPEGGEALTRLRHARKEDVDHHHDPPAPERSATNRLGWSLGFRRRRCKGATRYVGDGFLQTCTMQYFYLCIDDFHHSVNNNFVSVIQNSAFNANVLARISLKSPSYTWMVETDYKIVSEPRKYFGPVDLQRLHVRVCDDHGKEMNLNWGDFSFCLVLQTVYDL